MRGLSGKTRERTAIVSTNTSGIKQALAGGVARSGKDSRFFGSRAARWDLSGPILAYGTISGNHLPQQLGHRLQQHRHDERFSYDHCRS